MNDQDDLATREYAAGIVECRICGLKFLPDLEEDANCINRNTGRSFAAGSPTTFASSSNALPGTLSAINRYLRTSGKSPSAPSFAWWARAMSNGIPENHFERFVAAQLTYIDASVSGDEEQMDEAGQAIKRWYQYG